MSVSSQSLTSELKPSDVAEISRLFEAEYNQPNLHDRVLIFDVVASPPRRLSVGNGKENENKVCDQNEDHTDDTTDIANNETGIIRGGNQTKTQASRIVSIYKFFAVLCEKCICKLKSKTTGVYL